MRFLGWSVEHRRHLYGLERITGSLLCLSGRSEQPPTNAFPPKLADALRRCQDPYHLKPAAENQPDHTGAADDDRLGKVARRLIALSRVNFWIACRYASLGRPQFADAAQAVRAFHRQTAGQDPKELCLSRSLFAARMSGKFADTGVILIGALLPSRSLHAWVIEDGAQPDPTDSQWVNFQPVAALY